MVKLVYQLKLYHSMSLIYNDSKFSTVSNPDTTLLSREHHDSWNLLGIWASSYHMQMAGR